MTSPDATTLARDEWTALTQMDDRFCVLCVVGGLPFFKTGRTLSSTPGFSELAWMRPFILALRTAHDVLAGKLEWTPPLARDGTLFPADANSLDTAMRKALDDALLPPSAPRQRASSCVALYDRANIFGTTKNLSATMTFQALGIAHTADVAAKLTTEV
jgi:hypothetical protein